MFKNILVPVDLSQSDSGRAGLAAAVKLADATGAKLHLLNVVADVPNLVALQLPAHFTQTAMNEARDGLAALVKEFGLADGSYEIDVRHGTTYHEILSVAEGSNADVIVIASQQPDSATYLLGSVAAKVVRHAHCSVLVIRQR